MRLRVLGSSGAEFPGHNLPAFLIDGTILLDAGTIGAVLDERAQWKIRHVIITHAHLDHIRGIPFLADNVIVKNKKHLINIIGSSPTISAIKHTVLNNRIWPDFTALPDTLNPVLGLQTLRNGHPIYVNGYKIRSYAVNHSVPATGYLIEDDNGRRLLYTGDTGPTEAIWTATGETVHCLIVEVSLPNRMKNMALRTGHLTAGLLRGEMKKMRIIPDRIFVSHIKPQYKGAIEKEIKKLGLRNVGILRDGDVLEI
jgi:ribonuclease BN (tRNA processing enzyme)